MKLRLLSLACLLSFSSFSYANPTPNTVSSVSSGAYSVRKAAHCNNQAMQLTDMQARDVLSALFINNILLLQHFLSSYCIDGSSLAKSTETNPMYVARTDEALKYMLSAGFTPLSNLSPETKIDILSFFLIQHVSNKKFMDEKSLDIEPKLLEIEQQLKIPGLSKSKPLPLTLEERNKIIKTLLSEYQRTDFFHRDFLNNNVSTYAILTSEPEVFGKSLTISPHLALLQKNKDKLTLAHIAMLPKHPFGTEQENVLKLRAINNFILSNINDRNVSMVRYEDLNIVDFALLLQDNNPELAQGIIQKFPEIKPLRYENMTPEQREAAKNFFNKFDYLEQMKDIFLF